MGEFFTDHEPSPALIECVDKPNLGLVAIAKEYASHNLLAAFWFSVIANSDGNDASWDFDDGNFECRQVPDICGMVPHRLQDV
jgi:hypothetical protein